MSRGVRQINRAHFILARQLHDHGVPPHRAALMLGRAPRTVQAWYKRMGPWHTPAAQDPDAIPVTNHGILVGYTRRGQA